MKKIVAVLSVMLTVVACGGGEDGGASLVDLDISPKSNADAGSSFSNSVPADIHISYLSLPRPQGTGTLQDAIAYLDANGDGLTDIFMGTGEFRSSVDVNTILYLNNGSGSFSSSTAEFVNGSMPPANHARKSLSADFNGDGLKDVLVLDHGFDAEPFPGNVPKLVLSQGAGVYSWEKLEAQTGFHHGGAAADVDSDDDIDIFVGGFNPFFYINDGSGQFTKVDDRFDGSVSAVFTAELIDVDKDGYVDLLVGSHERDGNPTRIYWGSSKGSYSVSLSSNLPSLEPFGAILDFDASDLDGDGDRDLIINRTRDGDDGQGAGFYQGATVQYLLNSGSRNFSDVSQSRIDLPGDGSSSWFPWIRLDDFDNDGFVDFGPDDRGRGFYFRNDGSGSFVRTNF